MVVVLAYKYRKGCTRLNTNHPTSSARIPYRVPNLPLLLGFAESGMVEKMRAVVIGGIPNPTRIR